MLQRLVKTEFAQLSVHCLMQLNNHSIDISVLNVLIDICLFLSSCKWSFVTYWSFLIQKNHNYFTEHGGYANFQQIWRNKYFIYIYLTETQAKEINIRVTKIASALWETLAQSASRVRGCLFEWGVVLVFFLLFCILWPFLLAKGVSCLVVGIHPLAGLSRTASVLPQISLIRHKSPSF